MATLYNDNVLRGGTKIGYYEGNRFLDMDGKEVGYYENDRIYGKGRYEQGYIENGNVYRSDDRFYDEAEKVRQHVSGGNYPELPCAAVAILFGWD